MSSYFPCFFVSLPFRMQVAAVPANSFEQFSKELKASHGVLTNVTNYNFRKTLETFSNNYLARGVEIKCCC